MTLHADAVRVLSGWDPPDAAQETLRHDFLAHLDQHPDGVWRDCAPAHVTASSLVVDPSRRQVLLLLHAKANLWLPSGGHCEPGDDTLAAAALREAREETGMAGLRLVDPARPTALDRHAAPCRPGIVDHHLDVHYLAIAPPGATPSASAESRELRWFGVDELPEPIGSDVPGLVRQAALLWRTAAN
jgi:8-oxo-dGTP pyrophosphatase MutT (NUDIX family)